MSSFQKIKLIIVLLVSSVFSWNCATQELPFRTAPWDYDFKEIWPYLVRSAAVYESDEYIHRHFGKDVFIIDPSNIKVKTFVETDLKKKLQWIAVQGTANFKNIKEDVEFTKVKDPILGVYLHRGFQKTAMETYKLIKPNIKKDFSIKITGHSLGAAIAVIIEAYLHYDGYRVEKAITFGQPKVTNKKGMEKLNFLPLLRVINHEDPVPLLAPVTLVSAIQGIYRHFGPELILENPPKFVLLKSHPADRFSVTSFWENLGDIDVKDHHIAQYCKYVYDFIIYPKINNSPSDTKQSVFKKYPLSSCIIKEKKEN
jgi:triacylglycerol lipase